MIKKFKYREQSYFGGEVIIDYKNDNFIFLKSDFPGMFIKEIPCEKINITEQSDFSKRESNSFENLQLNICNELQEGFLAFCRMNCGFWENFYKNKETLDGTSWEFKLYADSISILTNGYASFPENFEAFQKALSKLTGGIYPYEN